MKPGDARQPREVFDASRRVRASAVRAETFREERMSRHRGDWDEDFYAGGPRARRREDEGRGAGWRYEHDERDAARGGRGWGLRGDYDTYVGGRGDYYRDDSETNKNTSACAGAKAILLHPATKARRRTKARAGRRAKTTGAGGAGRRVCTCAAATL
ncbi:MAG: hypothetical protein DMF66_10765 [Acidobacteria bacterium]|nr:MAG: hypothetical protein DMF66_10765 [Acidobacteriota bacterium]